jgi:hypothetical protein
VSSVAHVSLDNVHLALQTIAHHILTGNGHERRLQLHTHHTAMGKPSGQKQGHNPAAGAQIKQWQGGRSKDKIRQQEGIKRKTVAPWGLAERQLPGPGDSRWLLGLAWHHSVKTPTGLYRQMQ